MTVIPLFPPTLVRLSRTRNPLTCCVMLPKRKARLPQLEKVGRL